MIKDEKNLKKTINPKIAIKLAPDNTADKSNDDNKIDLNNVYSINRIYGNDTIEGGISATYGFDYSIFKKTQSKEVLRYQFANNLRVNENDDLPNKHQIGEKTSNFFNKVTFSPNDFIDLNYNIHLKNNFTDKEYENVVANFTLNNFVTSFDYINDNSSSLKNSYLENVSTFNINKDNNIKFSTRKNINKDLTEYYNLMYQYKNDCLTASVEYSKDYYSDRDIKPEESLIFKLTLIPLGGAISSPSLN